MRSFRNLNALPKTFENIRSAELNLEEYFGADCLITDIGFVEADAYAKWLRETPLNRRMKKGPAIYSEATVNRRIKCVRQIFRYAKKVGWVSENPFEYVKGGESVNADRWEYVDAETVETVIEASHLPKWRAIIALGRFAGVRGSSELYNMTWADVQWSSEGEPGSLIIKAEKNRRHGRQFRTVPMHPIVERELSTLFEQGVPANISAKIFETP